MVSIIEKEKEKEKEISKRHPHSLDFLFGKYLTLNDMLEWLSEDNIGLIEEKALNELNKIREKLSM